jgi:hypothetical protein
VQQALSVAANGPMAATCSPSDSMVTSMQVPQWIAQLSNKRAQVWGIEGLG